jgi:4-alpha-glucanotransferase
VTLPLEPRASGVLLHVTSLPSPWGTGDLGPAARDFARRLGAAGQRYWQVLPLNPTTGGAGESPYFSSSSRAGNPLLISIEDLAGDGLLGAGDGAPPADDGTRGADFERARRLKAPLLARACAGIAGDDSDFRRFCEEEADWLADHALFTALRQHDARPWAQWPEPLRRREPAALAEARHALAPAVMREQQLQYLFQRQWQRLRDSCRGARVWLFGDMPIYVNYDSVDVWARPDIFRLDEALRPLAESGVPPDYFSETGQLWRNPVYDWERLATDGFAWWVQRLGTLLRRLDVLRIDHFRGLVQFWEVPAGAETAIGGQWRDVPSHALFDTLRQAFDPFPVVAEDLGIITPDVTALRRHFGFPGMVLLHFAFGDDDPQHPYLPQNHPEDAIAYLGTHDNNTVRGAIELLLASPARTAIVCAQDLLALPGAARMNRPGLAEGNWTWQLSAEQFEALPLTLLHDAGRAHGRCT